MNITSAFDNTTIYKVVLSSGTVLWVPKDNANSDCVRLQAWVVAGNAIQSGS